jgi:transcriptional antiterminator RfaH
MPVARQVRGMLGEEIMHSPAWFCVRTQQKHEHIAAAHLRRVVAEVEVFNPRLRIRRATKRGAVWFVEALFPGYLFAKFVPAEVMMDVRGTPGVKTIVMFGAQAPLIPDGVIEHLRGQFDATESIEVPLAVEQGVTVKIAGGPFHGLDAEVLRVMPSANRVQVLLEILGGLQRVEVALTQVVAPKRPPLGLAR